METRFSVSNCQRRRYKRASRKAASRACALLNRFLKSLFRGMFLFLYATATGDKLFRSHLFSSCLAVAREMRIVSDFICLLCVKHPLFTRPKVVLWIASKSLLCAQGGSTHAARF